MGVRRHAGGGGGLAEGVGRAATAEAALTRGWQRMQLREPVGRPHSLGSLMFATVVGKLGSHEGGGCGGRWLPG
jgi:hypothetical protein